MKWHARFVFLGFATVTLGMASAPAHAQSDSDEEKTPGLVEHLFKVDISAIYGNLEENPIAGQGFVKPSTGEESRIVETPDSFSFGRFEARLGIGNWYGSYEKSFGSASASSTVEPGANGDLFLGVNERGNNGRIFRGFGTEEKIEKEYDSNRFKAGRKLWNGKESYVALYFYYDTSTLDYQSDWNVSEFPDARSEIEHRLKWDAYGAGLDLEITLFPIGDNADFVLRPEAWIGWGDYDYEATQQVLNPPNPDDEFSAVDHIKRTAWGSEIEGSVRFGLSPRLEFELFGGMRMTTMPTLTQPNGNELLQGSSNGLDFVSPREYFVGARLRF